MPGWHSAHWSSAMKILVGKRQDKHLSFIIQALAQRGLRLAWCEYQGDDPQRLTAALRRSFASGDVVFSFGALARRRMTTLASARRRR